MTSFTGRTDCSAIIKPSANPKFGDYQANGVMALAKQIKTKPRQLAEKVVEILDLSDICQPPEIAGPGFINLRLKTEFIEQSLLNIHADLNNRLAVEKVTNPKTVVIDFSGPNIAKQMHIGHLRSTIIGDCICRMLEFLGYNVIRQNHIGDWGTQFGMLIAHLHRKTQNQVDKPLHISDLELFYKQAKLEFDSDPDFATTARNQVVKLQSHEESAIKSWKYIVDESRSHYQPIYEALSVNLHQENERGESFYGQMLADVVQDLKNLGLAQQSDGAICVFPPGFKNKQGNPLPFIIQKSDGAFLYATTDLAALRYRINKLKAEKIV